MLEELERIRKTRRVGEEDEKGSEKCKACQNGFEPEETVLVPKLRIVKKASPKKVLTWLRDSYVNMMLRLANTRVVGSYGYGEYGYGSGLTSKEYDEKKLVEIYKSMLMAQGNIVPKLSDVPSY